MKKLLLLIALFGFIFLAILFKPSENNTAELQPPTDGTIVLAEGEDFPKRKEREAWFELMHKAAEGVDWKAIEIENRKEQAARKLQMRKTNGYERNTSEIVADGNLRGKWLERGSNNNAGSMLTVNYLVEDDMLYGLSDGGTLWKGDRSGFNWEVVNQDFRFSSDLVEARYLEDGTLRVIAGLNGGPVYSDDGGITWTEGQGLTKGGGAFMKDFVETDKGDIFILQRSGSGADYIVYRSIDNGTSWSKAKTFFTSDRRNLNLASISNTEKVVVIEQKNIDQSAIHIWNPETEVFETVESNSPISFENNQTANLNATFSDDSLRLYTFKFKFLDDDTRYSEFSVSLDTGATWTTLTNLPTDPWSVGVYVSPSDHTKMMYGEVNPYRSQNGGKFWGKVSNWDEYYNDIFTKLHADIMDIKEFKLADGTPVTFVCNHGGVSQSFDYGETYENIGLISLNIGQFYSVATHPTQREFVFGGTQDQGFQRGKVFGDDIASMDQVISGDYGHIVFSGTDDNLWTVYPWGWVTYYENPLIQGYTASFGLERGSHNLQAWIPPLVAHPDKSRNTIFMAGGSLDTPGASHIIQLDVNEVGEIVPTQLPFDFTEFGNQISALAFNHFNHDEMYALTTNGISYKSIDAGQTFERKEFGFPGGHYLYGNCIRPSKLDPEVIYISGSGYSSPGVFKSIDGGESFVPMSNGLPSTMVFSLAPNEDESLIFAATEAGPYVYVEALDEWFDLSGVGTPNQRYWSVEYLEDSKTARFGTYGRGIWDFEFEQNIVSVEDELTTNNLKFRTYPNPFTNRIVLNSSYDDLTNVSITDQQGRLMKKFTNKKIKNLSLDLSDLNNGIYFVTIRMNNKSVTEKIVKSE
ncbi:MAG: T9SS type A sorting domain-containing protein [Saprospiraceae bacterium]|nr:T9SS type A sorting domain-containing protein [Saprospiraceae bacterium]